MREPFNGKSSLGGIATSLALVALLDIFPLKLPAGFLLSPVFETNYEIKIFNSTDAQTPFKAQRPLEEIITPETTPS